MFRVSALLVALCLVLGLAGSGLAQDFACGGGCYGYGYGYGYGGYNLYGGEHIPYFALYPPVYYSYPVPRTYGYSPFAYPPGVMTPEIEFEEVEAKVMVNPYVPKDGDSPAPDRTTRLPVRIKNPFVNETHDLGGPQLALDLTVSGE